MIGTASPRSCPSTQPRFLPGGQNSVRGSQQGIAWCWTLVLYRNKSRIFKTRCGLQPVCRLLSYKSCVENFAIGPRWRPRDCVAARMIHLSYTEEPARMPVHHRERHRTEHVGWLRAAVLGANDGIISTASLVLGVAAAHGARSSVLVAGIAGLVAG